MGIWKSEMRSKNKLAQRGKGNRRNRRFVSLQRGDFEKVSYFECAYNLGGEDRKTTNGTPSTGKPRPDIVLASCPTENRFDGGWAANYRLQKKSH